MLEQLAEKDTPKYETFWKTFGRVLKEGLPEDHANRERLAKLLRFSSTHHQGDEQTVSLADYVGRMKDGQAAIYYITADGHAAARHSPHLEIFRKLGVEVLLLHERIDEWVASSLDEFDGKPLQSAAAKDLDLSAIGGEAPTPEDTTPSGEHALLLERMQTALADRASAVRVTTRLTESPACLVSSRDGLSTNLERLMKAAGQAMPASKPILEVNAAHPLVRRLGDEVDPGQVQRLEPDPLRPGHARRRRADRGSGGVRQAAERADADAGRGRTVAHLVAGVDCALVGTRWLVPALVVCALAPSAAQREAPEVSRERLRADLEFLTSAPLEGRASLTPGAASAARFIADRARQGRRGARQRRRLPPAVRPPAAAAGSRPHVLVVRRSGEDARFEPVAVAFPDPGAGLALTLDVVFAGYGITAPEFGYDDYAGVDVRGKAVLVFDHEPREDDPEAPFHGRGLTLHANAWTKTWTAQRHGAAALLVVTEPVNSHRTAPRPPSRANAPPQALVQGELRIPRITIPSEAAVALLKATGRTPADLAARHRRLDAAGVPPIEGRRHSRRSGQRRRARSAIMERRRAAARQRPTAARRNHPGHVTLRPPRCPERCPVSRARTTTAREPWRCWRWRGCSPPPGRRGASCSCRSGRKSS